MTGLSQAEAEAILGILVEECGASVDDGFIYAQTSKHVSEWRFIGRLGFGGKFWRTTGKRADGTWGDLWLVSYYPEDETPERWAATERANERLSLLQAHQP